MKAQEGIWLEERPWHEPAKLFAPLAHQNFALFLDSADGKSRYSYIMAMPYEHIQGNGKKTLERLRTTWQNWQGGNPIADLPPFQGGAAGFLSYELGNSLHHITPPNSQCHQGIEQIPHISMGFYDVVLAFDHHQKTSTLFSLGKTEQGIGDETAAKTRATQFLALLEADPPPHKKTTTTITPCQSEPEMAASVEKTINAISEGEFFQANLSRPYEGSTHDTGWDLYKKLRQENKAPFCAYAHYGTFSLLSSSPERFLSLQAGKVETTPIKGTAKRHKDPKKDTAAANALQKSAKDRAENIMIIDLMRNDLSQSCEADSITVETLCGLESFTKVHHLVSKISGILCKDKTALDLLETCFPGGSITGAPKLRAMQWIAEQETSGRGSYCGTLGYLGRQNQMDMSILIRSILVKDNKIWFRAGAGITVQSNPQKELSEIAAKAHALIRACKDET